MPWLNEEVAGLLREYAELTQITGGDPFRVRNYEKAARSVRGWADDVEGLDAKGLQAIPGVGASIAAKIAEYLQTGSIGPLDDLRARIPPGVLELTRVPGLGPKRALQLNHDLGVTSVDELAAAIRAGRLEGLTGFGARSEERLLAGIEVYRQGRERVTLDVAMHTATTMVAALSAVPGCQRCAYAGSLRRWRETIGDVDVLAAAGDSAPLMAAFTAQPEVASVIASGPTKTRLELLHGTELNIAPDGSVDWPADFLAGFDLCVASVHSHFDQPRAEMTRRFVVACENPYVNVIGHPTTRRMGRRPPVDVDFGELFRACARTGTALEVNASPQRLDLPSDHIRAARDAGVRFAIDSDAHSVADLDNIPYGVGTAQRGWLTPDDVINTWPLDRLRAFLAKGLAR